MEEKDGETEKQMRKYRKREKRNQNRLGAKNTSFYFICKTLSPHQASAMSIKEMNELNETEKSKRKK